MKQLQRILSVLLAAGCALSASACGQEPASSSSEPSVPASSASQAESSQAEPAGVTYPIPGNLKFTYAIAEEPAVTTNVKSLADTPFIKALEEATGVTLDIQHPAGADGFSMLFASGALPDMISYDFFSYPGGTAKAVKDKLIYPLNDLIDENAPDLKAILESNDLYRKSILTSNGDIAGFPFIRGDDLLLTSFGMIMRKDWLDDLSLDVPQTPDELYHALKAFKEEKGAEVPLSLNAWNMSIFFAEGLITSPYGLPKAGFYQIDGTVHYGYAEDGYKGALEFMAKLYADGLLDPNYATIDSNTANANIMGGISGMTAGSLGGGIGNYLQTMESQDPNYDLVGVGSLVAKRGDIPMANRRDNPVTGTMTVITPACKNKEAAAQFLNYNYTEEGKMLFNFGVEGESYTIVDGKATYTELITKNPSGWTMQQALSAWSNSHAADYNKPPVSIAEDNISEYSKLSGDISTYVDEMRTKFISGIEPLDNFDAYLATLEQMGVQRLIELQQAALDEFNAR